jgi:hypothetical protein
MNGKMIQIRQIRQWLLAALIVLPAGLSAQQPQFSGFLQLDKRFNVGGDSLTTADFYNRFRLEMAAPLGDQLYTFSSVDFRFYDLPRVNSLAGLEDLNRQYPTELSLWEAYIDVYGLLFPNLDVRIGKQRLAWGTADKLNPTDNLNPDDFSDLVNFAEKVPTWAVKGSYYLGDFTLTGVWLPSFTPILLPRGGTSLFLGSEAAAFRDTLTLPAREPKNSMFAFKVSGSLGRWDYSLSYFNGYDDIPISRSFATTLDPLQTGGSAGRLELGFPEMQVIGVDFATEIAGFGLWGEGALFFPEKVISKISFGTVSSTVVELDDAPYFKFTLGGDYTFPGGVYLNGQWMHGFFTERGSDALHDYFFTSVEKKFFNDDIKITLGGGLEIAGWNNIGERFGYGVFPELAYQAIDNLEIVIGTFVAGGKPETLLGAWKDADQAYFRVKVNF